VVGVEIPCGSKKARASLFLSLSTDCCCKRTWLSFLDWLLWLLLCFQACESALPIHSWSRFCPGHLVLQTKIA
jgi:hypothetical protein